MEFPCLLTESVQLEKEGIAPCFALSLLFDLLGIENSPSHFLCVRTITSMTTMFPSAGAADSSNAAAAKNNPQTIALAFAVASLQNPVAAAAAMEGLAASSASTIDTSAPLTIPQALLDAAAAAAAASTAVSAPHQCSSDRRPLHLSSRQFARLVSETVPETNEIE